MLIARQFPTPLSRRFLPASSAGNIILRDRWNAIFSCQTILGGWMRVFGDAIVKLLHSEPPAHRFKIIEIGKSFRLGDVANCEMGEPVQVPTA